MLSVETSREVIELDVQLLLGNIDGWLATGFQFSLSLEQRISNWNGALLLNDSLRWFNHVTEKGYNSQGVLHALILN